MKGLVSRSWGIWLSATVLVTAGIEIISREYIHLHTIVVSCNFPLVQESHLTEPLIRNPLYTLTSLHLL